jgi:hypothetical protein
VNVNLSEAETVKCVACDGSVFSQHYVLKRIQGIMIGAPTDVPVPVPIWTCASCNHVSTEFIPPGVGTVEQLFGVKSTEDGLDDA